ncbi:MAG: purine-nucleoside phosphorylase [Gemmatimonadetes bacterium]|nr:MAG: purine-nucleoside phosphorylase [Gemmatimonadota bacterium]
MIIAKTDPIFEAAQEAAAYVKTQDAGTPTFGIVLGSGLGAFVDRIHIHQQISYAEIPHFPVSTVKGHSGKLTLGTIAGQSVVVMQGRFHVYEGYPLRQVVFPVAVLHLLGVQTLILTTASGGLNRHFRPADLMLITDVINFTFTDPLRDFQKVHPQRPSIREMTSPQRIRQIEQAAQEAGLRLQRGVFAWAYGPNYESPMEIEMLRQFADAVSMSTVPEWMFAKALGLDVIGISCITNVAVGHVGETTHTEVITVANQASEKLSQLLIQFMTNG